MRNLAWRIHGAIQSSWKGNITVKSLSGCPTFVDDCNHATFPFVKIRPFIFGCIAKGTEFLVIVLEFITVWSIVLLCVPSISNTPKSFEIAGKEKFDVVSFVLKCKARIQVPYRSSRVSEISGYF